ncbi:MAG: AAA family ATPase [Halobacteriaceae archaeon]
MAADQAVDLVVRAARPAEAGRGRVWLPEAVRTTLGVLSGDTVYVHGDDRTAATAWPAGAEIGDGEVRMDGELRTNAGVSVGETVRISPAAAAPAERVALRPPAEDVADSAEIASVLRRELSGRPVSNGERLRIDALGEAGAFTVVDTAPGGTVLVDEETTVELADPAGEQRDRLGVTYEDIGGLDAEIRAVRELVERPLTDPGLFDQIGVDPPTGVLLHGPPGTGKTLIARAVATEADASFTAISGPEVVSKYKGESEKRLRAVFEEARASAPAIVFVDEIDSLAPDREDGGDTETRLVAQLLSLMDGLEPRGQVVVIGATNRADAVDPALRRPGRLDREVEIGVPDREARAEILRIHARGMPLADDVDLDALADRAHGFVGADLAALATEAGMAALRRAGDDTDPGGLTVTAADFERAMTEIDASATREVVAERPAVDFDDVGGLDEAIQLLREAVAWPLAHPPLFDETGTDPPSGVLLYGPPGTGKTLLARALAGETGVNLVEVAGPELFDRYVGESERGVREVFERARRTAPSILFFDEFDAVASARRRSDDEVADRVVSQLLTEFDQVADAPGVVVVAATNRRGDVDPALRRPGRIETEIEVAEPDLAARREILAVHTRDRPLADDVDLDALAADLSDFTGADITALVREASMRAIRDAVDQAGGPAAASERAAEIAVRQSHFEAAARELSEETTRRRA